MLKYFLFHSRYVSDTLPNRRLYIRSLSSIQTVAGCAWCHDGGWAAEAGVAEADV
jgi:hypothetical protein